MLKAWASTDEASLHYAALWSLSSALCTGARWWVREFAQYLLHFGLPHCCDVSSMQCNWHPLLFCPLQHLYPSTSIWITGGAHDVALESLSLEHTLPPPSVTSHITRSRSCDACKVSALVESLFEDDTDAQSQAHFPFIIFRHNYGYSVLPYRDRHLQRL